MMPFSRKTRTAHDGKEIKTFVFMDLEGTGVPAFNPRITEFAFIAVHRDALEAKTSELPRVLDELVMCVNPKKMPTRIAAHLTGKI